VSALLISDVRVGQEFTLGPYTVTREEILAFAQQFDPQPFHLDEAAATSSVLGGLAASGWHTASILMRLICDVFFLKVDTIGSTGIEEMKWLKPVYVNDTLSGSLIITGVRNSVSKPDRMIVNFDAVLQDHKGTQKAWMRSMVIVQVAPS
jgi:acyl dehydratase